MTDSARYGLGTIMGLLAFFAPIKGLIICAIVFVAIDFITGVLASYKRTKRQGKPWAFLSSLAWNTIYKLLFVMAGIVLAWLIDTHILDFLNIKLANIFTGFICGVEFWSYLENAAEISNHPIFKALQKVVRSKMNTAMGGDIDIALKKDKTNKKENEKD